MGSGVGAPTLLMLRMQTKIQNVMKGLQEVSEKIEAAYNKGVIEDFDKQQEPKCHIHS